MTRRIQWRNPFHCIFTGSQSGSKNVPDITIFKPLPTDTFIYSQIFLREGIHIYLNGEEQQTKVLFDQLNEPFHVAEKTPFRIGAKPMNLSNKLEDLPISASGSIFQPNHAVEIAYTVPSAEWARWAAECEEHKWTVAELRARLLKEKRRQRTAGNVPLPDGVDLRAGDFRAAPASGEE